MTPSLVESRTSDPTDSTATTTTFADLGLPAELVGALQRAGLTEPFPVQVAAIPDALAGRDVLGRGRTGSGKTLAFGLPLLARTAARSRRPRPRRPSALVLTPTRELAHQVRDALGPYSRAVGLRVGSVVGGESYRPQRELLAQGVHVLVATPGRLADLVEQGACDLSAVSAVVLDEADRMADDGFLPDVCALLDKVPAGGQRLLFSATLDTRVQAVVDRYLVDPVTHSVDGVEAAVPDMAHHVVRVRPADKGRVVSEIAARRGPTLLFVRSRLGADRVAQQLAAQGLGAEPLHGGMSQHARSSTLARFKAGATPILVATDVAARGIHVDDVDLVLHVDPPADHRDYLHRAGRTARAGRAGVVVTLALPHQVSPLLRLLRTAGVAVTPVDGRPGGRTLVDVADARDPQLAAEEHRIASAARAAAARASRPRTAGSPDTRRRAGRAVARGGQRRSRPGRAAGGRGSSQRDGRRAA